jgi:hypothetical protein
MPFTPLHLGPGAALKALGGARFSFVVFGGAQVLMDIEPLARMIRGDSFLHGYTHTLAGATAIGALATLTGRPIGSAFLRLLRIEREPIAWGACIAGAFLGTYSHIALDALMHPDIRPWWPLSDANPWLGAVSLGALHAGCLALGALGAIGAIGVALRGRRS